MNFGRNAPRGAVRQPVEPRRLGLDVQETIAVKTCLRCSITTPDTEPSCPKCGGVMVDPALAKPTSGQPPAAKKRAASAFPWLVVAPLMICVILLVVSGVATKSLNTGAGTGADAQPSVTYTAQSEGPIEVSYNNQTNGMNHENWQDRYNAWSKVITPWPSDANPYITAQSHSEGDAPVVVQIFCGGVLVQRSESHGPFTIATAIARCP